MSIVMKATLTAIALTATLLVSCSSQNTKAETKDEILERLRSQIYDTVTTDETVTVSSTDKVFWTKSGTVWHSDPNCSALANASSVESGTVEQSGKDHGCKKCTGSN
jgi:outer membrane lipoprotein-sorting protein